MLKQLSVFLVFSSFVFTFDVIHLCDIYTKNSILNNKENYKPQPVGNRERYATCTGATWFHENYLAVLNLYGEKLTTYKFNKEENKFVFLQEISNKDGAQFEYPENLAISPDGTLLAVCMGTGGEIATASVRFYSIDVNTHRINPIPKLTLPPCNSLTHSVKFSFDGKYLICSSFDQGQSISIYRISNNSNGTLNIKPTYTKYNNETHLKTKSTCFTKDSKFIVSAYSLTVTESLKNPFTSTLVTRKFDASNGTINEIISQVEEIDSNIEDFILLQNDTLLIATDQARDLLLIYPFDSSTGTIGPKYATLTKTEIDLSFPHGLGISHDENFLAVANYGDDKCSIYYLI